MHLPLSAESCETEELPAPTAPLPTGPLPQPDCCSLQQPTAQESADSEHPHYLREVSDKATARFESLAAQAPTGDWQ
jgi:hypothetical protein